MPKPSVYTLAAELGLSPSSVSRALNNSPKISPARRREIRELAKKRGFSLRAFAPRLTNLCALVCTSSPKEDIFSSYTEQVINGLNDYCGDANIELSIFGSPISKLNKIDVVKELLRRGVDGAVIINTQNDCRFLLQLEKENFAYCCFLSAPPKLGHRALTVDQKAVAVKAVQYLVHLGHRHVAFLYTASCGQPHLDRLAGYREAMEDAGLAIRKSHIPSPPPPGRQTGVESGFHATRKILSECPEVTAIFAVNQDLIDGAALAVHRHGLSVPGDISLVGCDDTMHAEYFNPPLTVVEIPNRRLAHMAARWVHEQIKTGEPVPPPAHEPWMEGRLIVRESTAPPGTGKRGKKVTKVREKR